LDSIVPAQLLALGEIHSQIYECFISIHEHVPVREIVCEVAEGVDIVRRRQPSITLFARKCCRSLGLGDSCRRNRVTDGRASLDDIGVILARFLLECKGNSRQARITHHAPRPHFRI
jgi:hypothetical protein